MGFNSGFKGLKLAGCGTEFWEVGICKTKKEMRGYDDTTFDDVEGGCEGCERDGSASGSCSVVCCAVVLEDSNRCVPLPASHLANQ